MKLFSRTIFFLLMIFALHFVALFLGVYTYQIEQGFVWFDNILHILVGILFGFAWIWFRKSKNLHVSLDSIVICVLVLAIGWELLEFAFLKTFPISAQDLKIYSPSIPEALIDIVSNMVGALICFIIWKLEE